MEEKYKFTTLPHGFEAGGIGFYVVLFLNTHRISVMCVDIPGATNKTITNVLLKHFYYFWVRSACEYLLNMGNI